MTQTPNLPGVERPDDKELNVACAAVREATRSQSEAKRLYDAAREEVFSQMQAKRDDLPTDDDGNPNYIYVDGEARRRFILRDAGDRLVDETVDSTEEIG